MRPLILASLIALASTPAIAAKTTAPASPAATPEASHTYLIHFAQTGLDTAINALPEDMTLTLGMGEHTDVQNTKRMTYTKSVMTKILAKDKDGKPGTETEVVPGEIETGYHLGLTQAEGDHVGLNVHHVTLESMQTIEAGDGAQIQLPQTQVTSSNRIVRLAPGESVDVALGPQVLAHIQRIDGVEPARLASR